MEARTALVPRSRAITRRAFLKWSAATGITGALGGMGLLSALGIVRGPQDPVPEWEVEPGVVDYALVPERTLAGPTPNVLRVAQWYDYWPGSFLTDFEGYIADRYGLTVRIQWDVYTSNEELFQWLTLGKRRYDVIFPTNDLVDLMKKAGMIYTLNGAWLPNIGDGFSKVMDGLARVPADNPYDQRRIAGEWRWVSAPYMWGTSGLGFRTDRLPKEEVTDLGYDLLWMDSYLPRSPGFGRVDLTKKMRMLDEMRDVIGAGLKKAGWEWQKVQNLEPTAIVPPQWSINEADPERIRLAGDWLFRNKPLLFDYSSTQQATSLLGDSPAAVINQGWSGDMMYAIQPNANIPNPVEYVIPRQGSTWWVDCAAIHSKSRNLWLAHELINFVYDLRQNIALTRWNLYSTPDRETFESGRLVFPNGWDMTQDERLYPNLLAPETFRICDPSLDVGLDVLQKFYNPLWFQLATA